MPSEVAMKGPHYTGMSGDATVLVSCKITSRVVNVPLGDKMRRRCLVPTSGASSVRHAAVWTTSVTLKKPSVNAIPSDSTI